MRAFMVIYRSFWSPAAHCILLQAYMVAGGSFLRVTLGGLCIPDLGEDS